MSHFECCLNRHFWRSKKLYKLSKLGRGGGNLDKIQKNSNFFFVKPSLISTLSEGKVVIGFLSNSCLNRSFNFHASLPVNHFELTNIALFLFCICVCLCSLCKFSMVQNVWTPRVKQLYSDDMCRICPTSLDEGLILFGYLIWNISWNTFVPHVSIRKMFCLLLSFLNAW